MGEYQDSFYIQAHLHVEILIVVQPLSPSGLLYSLIQRNRTFPFDDNTRNIFILSHNPSFDRVKTTKACVLVHQNNAKRSHKNDNHTGRE